MSPASDLAPGGLELVRRFENTVELPNGPDELDSIDRAADWCLSHGLPPVCTPEELERLRAFREALREVLFANSGGGDIAAAWSGLRSFVSSARLGLTVNEHRGLDLSPANPESEGAIATLLAIVYEALLDRSWFRLRACRKSSCRFAYYDRTKNASRAWCSMATCGNQAKAQRRRQRQRTPSP
jgi:predicted RNA-binding Zn ribbon-like protein